MTEILRSRCRQRVLSIRIRKSAGRIDHTGDHFRKRFRSVPTQTTDLYDRLYLRILIHSAYCNCVISVKYDDNIIEIGFRKSHQFTLVRSKLKIGERTGIVFTRLLSNLPAFTGIIVETFTYVTGKKYDRRIAVLAESTGFSISQIRRIKLSESHRSEY